MPWSPYSATMVSSVGITLTHTVPPAGESHDIGKIPRTGSVKEEVTRYLRLPLIVFTFSHNKKQPAYSIVGEKKKIRHTLRMGIRKEPSQQLLNFTIINVLLT